MSAAAERGLGWGIQSLFNSPFPRVLSHAAWERWPAPRAKARLPRAFSPLSPVRPRLPRASSRFSRASSRFSHASSRFSHASPRFSHASPRLPPAFPLLLRAFARLPRAFARLPRAFAPLSRAFSPLSPAFPRLPRAFFPPDGTSIPFIRPRMRLANPDPGPRLGLRPETRGWWQGVAGGADIRHDGFMGQPERDTHG